MTRRILIGFLLVLALLVSAAVNLLPAKVPPEVIEAAVTRSQALLDRAWQLPVAATFDRHLAWQSNPSVCGAATLANIFRSLREEPDTEGEALAGVDRCWFGICPVGLTLDQLAEAAQRKTERKVTVLRDLTPEAFHAVLRQANDQNRRYIVNFSRKAIFGAGVGHHSPIGGYLEEEDLVLVLDVNRNFQPWLIERARLYAAVDTTDGERKRGILLIEQAGLPSADPSLIPAAQEEQPSLIEGPDRDTGQHGPEAQAETEQRAFDDEHGHSPSTPAACQSEHTAAAGESLGTAASSLCAQLWQSGLKGSS
jgi:Phytochelatin synthase